MAERLRPADLAEVQATCVSVVGGMQASIEASAICVVAEREGQPVILLGCVEDAGRGVPWLLATTEVARYPGALTKIGRHYVGIFKARWPVLINAVDARNSASIRWLERLGFKIGAPQPFGLNGELFRPFTMGV